MRRAALAIAVVAACGGAKPAVKRQPPEEEWRWSTGIPIRIDPGRETPSAGETPVVTHEPTGEAAEPATQGPPLPAPTAEESDPGVRLLDAGRGAKRQLRYHPTAGALQARTIDVEMEITIDMGGSPYTPPASKSTVKTETRVDAVAAENGDIELTTDVTDVQTPGAGRGPGDMADQVKGAKITRTITNRAVVVSSNVTGASFGTPQIEQLADRLTGASGTPPALPAESVGAGARWEETLRVDVQGVIIEVVTTSDLVAIETDRATIRFASSISVDARALSQGGVSWNNIVVTEHGEHTIHFAKLVPERTTRELRFEATMSMDGSGSGDVSMKGIARLDARAQ